MAMTCILLIGLSTGAADILGAELAALLRLPQVTMQDAEPVALPEEGAVLCTNALHLRPGMDWLPEDCCRIWLDTPPGDQPGQRERYDLLAPLAASLADYRVDCDGLLNQAKERLFALMALLGHSGAQRRLEALRRQLDEVDAQLMEQLRRRMQLCDEVGALKARHRLPIEQTAREAEVLRRAAERVGPPYGEAAQAVTRTLMEQCKLRQAEVAKNQEKST